MDTEALITEIVKLMIKYQDENSGKIPLGRVLQNVQLEFSLMNTMRHKGNITEAAKAQCETRTAVSERFRVKCADFDAATQAKLAGKYGVPYCAKRIVKRRLHDDSFWAEYRDKKVNPNPR
jgi:hypothetical protein